MIPSLPLTDTINSFADLRTVVPSGRKSILLRYHTNPNDGGGGIFDIVPVGSYVDDGGRVAVSGSFALVRRGSEIGPINAAWYGIVGDGTTDWTTALQALFDVLPVGRELYIPRGLYRITDTLHVRNAPNGGFIFKGEGCIDPNPNSNSTTIVADFETQSGTTATISSIIDHNPSLDPYAKVVTLTGLTGIANAKPGDTIKISNAAAECNNGYFTLMSVYPADGYVTFLGFNMYAHAARYEWFPVLPEANNGSLHWEIRKPMVSVYTRDVLFDTIFFEGNNTCGACVDSTATGSGGVPSGSFLNTNIRFTNVRMVRGFSGVKIGDFSGYATGGCTEVNWTNNCDFHVFDFCSITLMEYACICVSNATSNSLQHTIKDTSLQYAQYGIAIRRGSFVGYNINFTSNTGADILNLGPSDPCSLWGGGSEHSTRFLVLGLSGYMTSSPVPIPMIISGVRTGSSNAELPADKCFMQISSLGSVTFKNCQFFYGDEMTFGAQGYHPYANKQQVSMTFEGCSFSCATYNDIVTAMPGPFNHKVWFSAVSCTTRNGVDVPTQVPNGILEAKGPVGTTETAFPLFQIGQLGTPAISTASLIVDGYNNAVDNPYRTSVTVTGPTDDVILNGINAGENGQRLELKLSYNQITTINHLSSSAAAGARIVTLSATPIVLPAPGANSYSILQLQYDPSADSGNGAWVVKDLVRPIDQDVEATVTTIADLRALAYNPKLVHVTRYAAVGTETGGGDFEYVPGDTTTPDDGGIWFVNAVGGRYRRGNSSVGRIWSSWYGIFGDNTTDQTTAISTLLNSRNPGDVVFFEKGRHRITNTIDIGVRGITIIGQGVLDPNPYIDSGTVFTGAFATVSGTTATMDSAVANPPDTDAYIVTLSGLTSLTNVLPGDTIHVSNAALERNNGYFTIMSVNSGAGTLTYLSYNQFVHTVDYQWAPTPTGETNNGSLHWEIRKSMFRIHNETSFKNVFFNGANTVGTLVDSGYKGSNGTPGVGAYDGCTGNRFNQVSFRSAYHGLKIGDFANYATGGCTQVTWANGCDLHYLEDVRFTDCNHSGFCIPSSSGTSVLHNLDYVSVTECGIGLAIRKGSFKAKNLNFAANTHVDLLIQGISDTSVIQGGHSEGSPRFLVVGSFGYFASTSTIIPLLIESYRADQNVALPADNCYIQSGALGGLVFKSCNFESALGSANWTIGVQGRATTGSDDLHARAVWLTFEGCTFPQADRTKIVTAMAGSVGLNPSWYYSLGSSTIAPGSYLPIRLIDGVHAAYNSPTSPSLSPSTQLLQINIPSVSIASLLVDGYNNAVANPYRTSISVTGPTATTIINGIVAGEPGQTLTLRLKYNQITEINHLSSSASAGRRIITPDTDTLSLWAPGASPSYNILSLEYDTSEDSGNGAWVVTGYISGSAP